MTQRLDHRRAQAMRRFAEFFTELKGTFREREDVLDQVALALLAREHVLMTGPPGTAKSQLSSAVVGRIRCEQSGQPSLFSRQFTESTVQTDLIGPVNFKTLTETGRTEHFTDEGMLGAVHAGTVGKHRQPLRAPLSIQDLDVLQAMVEQVEVPAHVLTQLRELVESFEREQRLAMMRFALRHLFLFVSGKLEQAGLGDFCCASRPLRLSAKEQAESA